MIPGNDFKEIGFALLDSPLAKIAFGEKLIDPSKFNESVDKFSKETREFGLDKCAEAAKSIFTPDVIKNWSNYSEAERKDFVNQYAGKVAEAFELRDFKNVSFEKLEPGLNGYNSGDGIIHLTDRFLNKLETPIQLIDTVTHEMRHQYQSEAIRGLHNIPSETRKEWGVAEKVYTTNRPWAADPWGYKYNPLEIDSNYAAGTVIRTMTKDYINGKFA